MPRQFRLPHLNLKVLFAPVVVILAIIGAVFAFWRPWEGKGLLRRYENIANIIQVPDEFADRTVRIQGKVKQALFIPTLRVSFLLIGDKTGEIWYREGGNRAETTGRAEEVIVEGMVQRDVTIPSVASHATMLIKYETVEDTVRYSGDFIGREVVLQGVIKQVILREEGNATFLLVNDETGEVWARVPETMAHEGESVILEGMLRPGLEVPGVGIPPMVVAAYDQIGQVLKAPLDYKGQQILIKGIVKQRVSIPLTSFTFLQLEDSSERIWCRTEQMDAKAGELTVVWGDVLLSVELFGKYYGIVIIERP